MTFIRLTVVDQSFIKLKLKRLEPVYNLNCQSISLKRQSFLQTFLKLSLGDRSYAAESRVTNLEYKNSYIYCEEKKQCAAIEIQSKIDLSSKYRAPIKSDLVHIALDSTFHKPPPDCQRQKQMEKNRARENDTEGWSRPSALRNRTQGRG